MRRVAFAAMLCLAACSSEPGREDGGGSGDGGGDGGTASEAWTFYGITPSADLLELDMAVHTDGRVGIAYFHKKGPGDGGLTDYELRYQEWKDGQISQPQTVTTVQRIHGLSLAFQPGGEPAVSYLGGDNMTEMGMPSAYWTQSDAVISRRSNGSWTEEVVTRFGSETTCPDMNSNLGFVVGIHSALAFSGSTTFLAWRDGHYGAFTGPQDWNGSDLEFAHGTQGNWQRQCVLSGAGNDMAWGGHIQMVVANGQPALVSDQLYGVPEGGGQNLVFNRRKPDGTWAPMVRPIENIGNTFTGPSLAWDPTLGFAIAVLDHTSDLLMFTRSVNDGVTWSEPDPVFQSGTGGWYPSLSINPESHEPSIAFYICARTAGVAEGACPENDDELRVTERIGGIWREELVDPAGAWHPRLSHLPSTKRAIAYRDPRSGAVKLAVER